MKNAIVLIVLSLLSVLSFGQNQKQYNQFIQCQGLLNPAYSGTREDLSGLVLYRKQWVNFDGAPETEAINVHSPIKFTHLGFGLSATNENIGLNHIFDCYGSAAYRLEFNRKQTLSLGVQLGVNSESFDGGGVEANDLDDKALATSSDMTVNAGFGAYFYSPKYFVGFTIPEFFTNEYDVNAGEYSNKFDMGDIHYYLYGGYVFEFNPDFSFKPTALMRIVEGSPIQFDIDANFLIYNRVWAGLGYKTSQEAVFLLQYIINQNFTICYSYDYPFTDLSSVSNSGSHEISLLVDFSLSKTLVRSIRYF